MDLLGAGFGCAVHDGVPVVWGDVGNPAMLAKVFVDHDIAAVTHFFGSVQVGESVSNPLKYQSWRATRAGLDLIVADAMAWECAGSARRAGNKRQPSESVDFAGPFP